MNVSSAFTRAEKDSEDGSKRKRLTRYSKCIVLKYSLSFCKPNKTIKATHRGHSGEDSGEGSIIARVGHHPCSPVALGSLVNTPFPLRSVELFVRLKWVLS